MTGKKMSMWRMSRMILPESCWESIRPYFLSRARELVEETWVEVAGEIDNRLKDELREALSKAFSSSLTQALEEKFLSRPVSTVAAGAPNAGVPNEDMLYYLYCVTDIEARDTLIEILSGHDAKLSVVFSEGGECCAVVGECSPKEFGEEIIQEKLEDMGWLEEKARLHQDVIEDVMKAVGYPVIPMKFGSVFSSPERVLDMLREQRDFMSKALNYLRGRQEWGLKIYCRRDKLVQEIRAYNPVIKDMVEKASGGVSSGIAFMMKKKLEESIQIECDHEMERICAFCHQRLTELSCVARLNKLLGREITGEEAEMILNAAYLVDDVRMNDFMTAARELQNSISSSFSLSVTGPWPPYNFSGDAGSDESE
jgi:hypothetical protein